MEELDNIKQPYENVLEEDLSTELVSSSEATDLAICSTKDLVPVCACTSVDSPTGDTVICTCETNAPLTSYYWVVAWAGRIQGEESPRYSLAQYQLTPSNANCQINITYAPTPALSAAQSANIFTTSIVHTYQSGTYYTVCYTCGTTTGSAYFSNFSATTVKGTVRAVGHRSQTDQAVGCVVGRTGLAPINPSILLPSNATYFKTYSLSQSRYTIIAASDRYNVGMSGVDVKVYNGTNTSFPLLKSGRTGSLGVISFNWSGQPTNNKFFITGSRDGSSSGSTSWTFPQSLNGDDFYTGFTLSPSGHQIATMEDIKFWDYWHERGYDIPNCPAWYNPYEAIRYGGPVFYLTDEYQSYCGTTPTSGTQVMQKRWYQSAATTSDYYLNTEMGICAVDDNFWRINTKIYYYGETKGYVTNANGDPLAGVSVSACQSTMVYATATTQDNGFYSIYMPAFFGLKFAKNGYQTTTYLASAVPFTVVMAVDWDS